MSVRDVMKREVNLKCRWLVKLVIYGGAHVLQRQQLDADELENFPFLCNIRSPDQ